MLFDLSERKTKEIQNFQHLKLGKTFKYIFKSPNF